MKDSEIIEKAKWFEAILYNSWYKSINEAYEQGAKQQPLNSPVNVWRVIGEQQLKEAIVLARESEKNNCAREFLEILKQFDIPKREFEKLKQRFEKSQNKVSEEINVELWDKEAFKRWNNLNRRQNRKMKRIGEENK